MPVYPMIDGLSGRFLAGAVSQALKLSLLLALATSTVTSHAQDLPSGSAAGFSLQAYPAGFIPALHAQSPLTDRDMLVVFLGLNVTNRRDWGVHEDEKGSGFGAGIGIRHYLSNSRSGFYAGIRSDIWFLKIDWTDNSLMQSGVSDVTVFQPTAQIGYDIPLGSHLLLGATVGVGKEINTKTQGASVGQGAILLGGLRFSIRLPADP